MAVTNPFIVYREVQKLRQEAPADHAEFLTVPQAQLPKTTDADFVDEEYTTCLQMDMSTRHPDKEHQQEGPQGMRMTTS
ncbi:hypothetical protein ON010_g8136 [Phytophthora cinnamomi]|nr:hypothetical protein ON010_g8136 [Phytophthora cinnamomi]